MRHTDDHPAARPRGPGADDAREERVLDALPVAAVLGLGRSGLGAARLLRVQGWAVRALDLAPRPAALERWEALRDEQCALVTGPHAPGALAGCRLLVRSPGIPADAPILRAARQQGVPIVAEIELAAAAARGPIVAVTGTNGKSTTTAWTAHLLQRAGRAAIACGNIGHALSEAVVAEPEGTIFVTEVSSFQLEECPRFHPQAAVILNITPDHLDRHGTLAAYAAAKWSIAREMTPADRLLLGPGVEPPAVEGAVMDRPARPDEPDGSDRPDGPDKPAAPRAMAAMTRIAGADPGGEEALFVDRGRLIWRRGRERQEILAAHELALPGPHNQINALAAFGLAVTQVAAVAALRAGLRDFPGLAHRLERVAEANGVLWVNDSKATNVESLRVALQSYRRPIVLIAGGRDKAGDFEALGAQVARRLRHLITIGEASARLRSAWPAVSAEHAEDLGTAVARAAACAQPGDVVLLSPGCASFDMYADFAARGDHFRQLVRARLSEEGT